MANNISAFPDQANDQFQSWFELYNNDPLARAFDLSGYTLTDDLESAILDAHEIRTESGLLRELLPDFDFHITLANISSRAGRTGHCLVKERSHQRSQLGHLFAGWKSVGLQ